MLENEQPLIFGMLQRGGEVIIRMLENVQQTTNGPLIQATITSDTQMCINEYDMYAPLSGWGYMHSSFCHSQGSMRAMAMTTGFTRFWLNTIEGFWSL